jgi:hypothetical protein
MRFPTTKERPGYWSGVARNVGDALMYVILTADTPQIIECSIIQRAEDPKSKPKDATFDPELEPVLTGNNDDENVQMEETETDQPLLSPQRLTTLNKRHRHSHHHHNTNPEGPIYNDADEEDHDLFYTNMSSPEVNHCGD